MVYVTGATGLIGSFLLLELSGRGKAIRAMKRKDSSVESVKNLFLEFSDLESFEKIEWVETDLLDIPSLSETLENVETIYHTAASVGFDDRFRKSIQDVKVTGTENLVNLAIAAGVKNFAYISSVAVLDEAPGSNLITEESGWDSQRVHSEYAISKKKGEMAVWRASQEGLNVVVVHPSVVIGSLDGTRASEKIFELARRKKAYASAGLTGYVDVRDVVYSLAELVERKLFNQAYILTSEDKTFVEIFDFLRSRWKLGKTNVLSERKLKFVRIISQLGRIFGGRYMSKPSYHALTGKSKYSNNKIKDALGISFRPVKEALVFHGDRYLKTKSKDK